MAISARVSTRSLGLAVAPSSSSARVARAGARATRAARAGGVVSARLGGGFDRGVIDRPDFDLGRDADGPSTDNGGGEGAMDKVKRVTGGGSYRVILLDAENHTEGLVAKVLPQVTGCDELHAKNCYHTSKTLGMAIVTTAIKEMAEHYAQQLYMKGCRSTIEPDDATL